MLHLLWITYLFRLRNNYRVSQNFFIFKIVPIVFLHFFFGLMYLMYVHSIVFFSLCVLNPIAKFWWILRCWFSQFWMLMAFLVKRWSNDDKHLTNTFHTMRTYTILKSKSKLLSLMMGFYNIIINTSTNLVNRLWYTIPNSNKYIQSVLIQRNWWKKNHGNQWFRGIWGKR